MYIWQGADVDCQLGEIKKVTKEIEDRIGFAHSNFTLPLHISFKQSYQVEDDVADEVIDLVSDYFKTLKPFEISVKGIEHFGCIVWISTDWSERINEITDNFNRLLLEKYSVPIHLYDTDRRYHVTLFMDDDEKKVSRAYEAVKDVALPTRLRIDKLVIGTSPVGELGTYKVIKTIELSE
ncbi:MAG: 2'-5' RNA ligase family protein [Clostridia bacterium]|nr:2'-5' RNA ligase family protein [Clostridia bacterium]